MSQVQAVAPAFGVVVQIRDDGIWLQASDSGGRNAPHFAALVAVFRVGDRLHLARDPQPDQDEDRLKLEGVLLMDVDRKRSPYAFRINQVEWPDSDLALLLLGYIEPRGVGGDTRPRKRTWIPIETQQGQARADIPSAVRAIQQAIAADTLKELRTGLVRGRLDAATAKFAAGDDGPPRSVTFAQASCHFPSDILDHMPDDEYATPGPADASLLRLSQVLETDEGPTLLLLAGDQVYVDATAGLFDPKTKDDLFRAPYERRGQSRGVNATMQRLDLQVETMLDDHEIRDNWEPDDPLGLLRDGKEGYFRYQRALDPHTGRAWRFFRHRGVPFFLGDTRTEREGRTALNWPSAQIMGENQRRALCDWLLSGENVAIPKFFLTPSAFLPRQLDVASDPLCALHSDAWDGYPCSQHGLLKFACDNEVQGLVFLSGDEHISSFTTATVTHMFNGKSCILHSIHSSGLYAPYPFANATADDFPADDEIVFPHPRDGPYRCNITTRFADKRDGFALVTVRPRNGDWELQTTFWSCDGPKPDQPPAVILKMLSA